MTDEEIRRTLAESVSVPLPPHEVQEIREWLDHVREGVEALQTLPLEHEEPGWPPSSEEVP